MIWAPKALPAWMNASRKERKKAITGITVTAIKKGTRKEKAMLRRQLTGRKNLQTVPTGRPIARITGTITGTRTSRTTGRTNHKIIRRSLDQTGLLNMRDYDALPLRMRPRQALRREQEHRWECLVLQKRRSI